MLGTSCAVAVLRRLALEATLLKIQLAYLTIERTYTKNEASDRPLTLPSERNCVWEGRSLPWACVCVCMQKCPHAHPKVSLEYTLARKRFSCYTITSTLKADPPPPPLSPLIPLLRNPSSGRSEPD